MTDPLQDIRNKAEEVAYALQGSCGSLLNELENRGWEVLELNSEFLAAIDSLVFECEGCGWWFEISEMCGEHDTWKCEDCCHD